MKILLLDNYDSFTYNICHYLQSAGVEVEVYRNDDFELDHAEFYDGIVISPGPGLPEDAGVTVELIAQYKYQKPIFGICLGCQALAVQSGGELFNQKEVAHGISRWVDRTADSWLLHGLGDSFSVGLYHSWAIRPTKVFAESYRIVARRQFSDTVMAIEHIHLPIAGVQFHPESIMTIDGRQILINWLSKI